MLDSVHDVLHDRWFDLECATTCDGVVTVEFREQEGGAVAKRLHLGWRLLIHNAVSLSITDTEKIGLYDFNKITHDARSRIVRVHHRSSSRI